MRIRTGMGKITRIMSSRGTGLSSRRSSVLASSKSRRRGTVFRMEAPNASGGQSARVTRSGYESLQSAAASLLQQTGLLAEAVDVGEKNATTMAAKVVADFNDTMKYLKQSSGVLNDFYRQSLKETVLGQKKTLEEIGVKVASDGTLSLDKEKFAGAVAEKVKTALGSAGDFARRVKAVASRAVDNARANVESLASQYTAAGRLASSYLSKYSFRG